MPHRTNRIGETFHECIFTRRVYHFRPSNPSHPSHPSHPSNLPPVLHPVTPHLVIFDFPPFRSPLSAFRLSPVPPLLPRSCAGAWCRRLNKPAQCRWYRRRGCVKITPPKRISPAVPGGQWAQAAAWAVLGEGVFHVPKFLFSPLATPRPNRWRAGGHRPCVAPGRVALGGRPAGHGRAVYPARVWPPPPAGVRHRA